MASKRLIVTAIALILSVTSLWAATATQCYTGNCTGGGQWVTCITYDTGSGAVVTREGTMCGGTHWIDHCSFHYVDVNPGTTSDHFINLGTAWIRFNTDATGAITAMWGKNVAGQYWVADSSENNLL